MKGYATAVSAQTRAAMFDTSSIAQIFAARSDISRIVDEIAIGMSEASDAATALPAITKRIDNYATQRAER